MISPRRLGWWRSQHRRSTPARQSTGQGCNTAHLITKLHKYSNTKLKTGFTREVSRWDTGVHVVPVNAGGQSHTNARAREQPHKAISAYSVKVSQTWARAGQEDKSGKPHGPRRVPNVYETMLAAVVAMAEPAHSPGPPHTFSGWEIHTVSRSWAERRS